MEASTTYWEIFNEGFEMGRIIEARHLLLRCGSKLLGPPGAAVRARLAMTTDLSRLEDLIDSLLERAAATWEELV